MASSPTLVNARYAHLASTHPLPKEGSILHHGDPIGFMGSTGQSSADHLHFDLIPGDFPGRTYRLWEIPRLIQNHLPFIMEQYHWFIDSEMFGVEPEITTSFCDPHYIIKKKYKCHPGFDLVPFDRKETKDHYTVMWNRRTSGKVVWSGIDSAYGHNCVVQYKV